MGHSKSLVYDTTVDIREELMGRNFAAFDNVEGIVHYSGCLRFRIANNIKIEFPVYNLK